MSNLADYFCPDETPAEGDPTNEEMMSEEERQLQLLTELRLLVDPLYSDWTTTKKAWALFDRIEDYFTKIIAEREAVKPLAGDFIDPFAEDQ
jgi:hypothetical protein